jgi:predicted protein tyrosine phosphatase
MTETGNTLPRVLFLCTHNAARSQLAETFLRHYASDRFEVLSAGHPTTSRRQGLSTRCRWIEFLYSWGWGNRTRGEIYQ